MKSYSITINGKAYDITVEKRGASTAPNEAGLPPTPPIPASVLKKAATPSTEGSLTKIAAPMPGKIIAIKTNVGDSVKSGQELIILEAMKMHNPVLASTNGVVKEILVKAGDPVQAGSVLAIIG